MRHFATNVVNGEHVKPVIIISTLSATEGEVQALLSAAYDDGDFVAVVIGEIVDAKRLRNSSVCVTPLTRLAELVDDKIVLFGLSDSAKQEIADRWGTVSLMGRDADLLRAWAKKLTEAP